MQSARVDELAGQLVPRARAGAGDVRQPDHARVRQLDQRPGEMPGERRRADLVVDDGELVALRRQVQDGGRKARSAGAEQPGRADDRVLARRLQRDLELTGQLRSPVHRQRPRRVGLEIRLALDAVEHVVTRDVDHPRAAPRGRTRHVPGAGAVDGEGPILIGLGAVDVSPRGTVDDYVGARLADRALHRLVVGHVEIGARQRHRLVTGRAGGIVHVLPQHPRAAGDQKPHKQQRVNGRPRSVRVARMGERTKYTPGTFSWADVATTDQEAAKSFYGELFGWQTEDTPAGEGVVYTMAIVDGKPVAAISPQPQQQRDAGVPPMWNCYITVESADDALERARKLGATVHAPAFDVFDAGRMGVIQDPQGGFFEVWEPKQHIGAQLVNGPGLLSWNELASPDPDGSAGFYTELFGWTVEPMEESPMQYLVVKNSEGHANGGIRAAAEQEPTHWLAYFGTDALDDAVSKVTELGGTILMEPMDVGAGNRIAAARDPQGAVFALYAGALRRLAILGRVRRRGLMVVLVLAVAGCGTRQPVRSSTVAHTTPQATGARAAAGPSAGDRPAAGAAPGVSGPAPQAQAQAAVSVGPGQGPLPQPTSTARSAASSPPAA